MKDFLKSIWNRFLDLLFPKKEAILKLEKAAIEGNLASLPPSTKTPAAFINPCFSYKDSNVRTLVWAIKYKGNQILSDAVGKIIYENILEDVGDKYHFEKEGKIMLIPIPSSKAHAKERGFNQTELLADSVLKIDSSNIFTLDNKNLIRFRETPPQTKLPRAKRLTNLKESFGLVDPGKIAGQKIILIDDVATTGATLSEARRVLLEAGVSNVLAWTIAH